MQTFTLVLIFLSAPSFFVNGSDEKGLSLLFRAEESFEEEEQQQLLLDCVVRVSNRHFISDKEIIAILSTGSKDLVKDFKGINAAVVVRRLDGGFSMPVTTPRYREAEAAAVLIFLEGYFPRDIEMLDEALEGFGPRSRFLLATILTRANFTSARNYLNKIFEHLGENQRSFVSLTVAAQLARGSPPELYGYTRVAYGLCGKPTLLHFGNCRREISLSRIFSPPVNYNRCPLRLATFDWSPMTRFVIRNGTMTSVGIESNIANVIVESLNASTEFLNIPPSKIRKTIGDGKADIGWGQMALYDTNEYLYTKSYIFTYGLIILPKSSFAFNLTLNNLLPLEGRVWIALLVVVILVMVLRIVLPTLFKSISMLNILGLCLGLGTSTRTERLPHRLYFISWAFFGYVITQAYLTNLTLIFTKPEYPSEISSLRELDQSIIPFGGPESMRKIFENKHPRLYREYKVMNLTEFQENLINLKMGRGGLASYIEVSKWANYYHWKNTLILKEKMVYLPLAMIVPKVSDILAICNRVITRTLEAGLMEGWANAEARKNFEESDPKERPDIEVEDSMDLKKFSTIFQLFTIALSISVLVFIVEIIVFKLSSPEN